jgi:methylmalonyl-CoA mutase N-terminal domain/subunit
MKKNKKKYKNKWMEKVDNSNIRDYSFESASGEKVDLLYFPDTSSDYIEKLNFPGEFPYTRGIHPNMYRGKLWTMRQFAGFGSPEETNHRFKLLLSQGQTGLSVAFDMPTLMGYDADHEISNGEIGHCGVSISSMEDMETLFDGIDLSKISVSMTINGPAVIINCH